MSIAYCAGGGGGLASGPGLDEEVSQSPGGEEVTRNIRSLPCKHYSLVFVRRTSSDGVREVLLGRKKRGFGVGKLNGYGGKVEEGETAEEGARRELTEECGIIAVDMVRRGSLRFEMHDKLMLCEVYVVSAWEGEVVETEEMSPRWVKEGSELEALYETETWADDKFWLPTLLKGEDSFRGEFKYAEDDTTILDYKVKVETASNADEAT